jgi:hypothetical protein
MSVQQFNKYNSTAKPYHIYYDMTQVNNDTSFPSVPVQFSYKETRSNPFLLSPQDYYMSIVRFNLQTPSLPVMIPRINISTSTNFGPVYPISGMSAATVTTSNFVVYLYGNLSYPVGAVVYLGNNNVNPLTADASNTGNQYFRVASVVVSQGGANTAVTLQGYAGAVGNPSLYPSGGTSSATFYKGGTQTISYASLPVTALTFASGLVTLTTSVTGLTNLYQVGDRVNIANALGLNGSQTGFNGTYTVSAVASSTLTLAAGFLNTNNLLPYVSGGVLLPAVGEYYNVTPYVITMTYKVSTQTYSYSQAVVYQPVDGTEPAPSWSTVGEIGLNTEQFSLEYYYVYVYELFIRMVNQALTNCFWGLNGLVTNGTGTVPGQALPMASTSSSNTYQPPSMSWDPTALIASITADSAAFTVSPSATSTVFIYFNQSMSTLLDSFPYVYPNVPPASPLYSYILFSASANATSTIVGSYSSLGVFTSNYTGIVVSQDHQTASLMNPVQSIIFSTTFLPVVMENVGAPIITNGSSPVTIRSSNTANVFPIVTSFIVPFSAASNYKPDVTYTPSSEYRLVDMYGTTPVHQVDVQVFWSDPFGVRHPFFLGSGCSGSLKILFRRKDYFNVDLEE